MKRVMIVDDEMLVRIGIQSLINWEENGFCIVADASDGQEALEKMEHFQPDIVLTDLKMVPMDGFELIEKSREWFPHIQFIILSSYNDFENVRKAMRLGALDYIFKLTVKSEELLKVLVEAGTRIKAGGQQPEMDEITRKNLNVIKKSLLKKVMTAGILSHLHEQELRNLPLKISFDRAFGVLNLTIDNFPVVRGKGNFMELNLLLFTMENIIGELFGRCYTIEIFQWEEYDFVILLNRREEESDDEFAAAVEKEFHIFKSYARQYYGVEVSAALSKRGVGIADFRQALRENQETLKQRFFCESGRLCLYQPAMEDGVKSSLPQHLQIPVFKELAEYCDFHGLERYLTEIFAFWETAGWTPQDIRTFVIRLYRTLSGALARAGIDSSSYVDHSGVEQETAIAGYSFLNKIHQSVEEILGQCREAYESNQGGIRRREIAEVKSFVIGHLRDEITLPEIAKMVNMSASHFSHIFKKAEGVSFMEYVQQLRMERAKQLLRSSDLKINEVAEQIGIENANYFSAQFKRRTGSSPLEYRQQHSSNSRI